MAEIKMPQAGSPQGGLARERNTIDNPVPEKKEIEKVELKGSVTQKKPSLAQKFRETFVAEDLHDIGDYIIWDILVPTIKRTIRDVIVGSADRVFLGNSAPQTNSSLYRERGVTYVRPRTDYGQASRRPTTLAADRYRNAVETRPMPTQSRVNFGLNDIVFDKYEDASSVLERMVDYLDTYGQVSVDDFFDLIGRSAPYTSQKWGWTSLSTASIVNTIGGYFIKLPNPVEIKE